ncbi:hypothetical protein BX600DRAFT_435652 [Xylariales sp. PMI_506]|nr:hypothetical protein BX600DRAFT_435652 [Xylariales sp. PMI_506]
MLCGRLEHRCSFALLVFCIMQPPLQLRAKSGCDSANGTTVIPIKLGDPTFSWREHASGAATSVIREPKGAHLLSELGRNYRAATSKWVLRRSRTTCKKGSGVLDHGAGRGTTAIGLASAPLTRRLTKIAAVEFWPEMAPETRLSESC